MAVLLVALPAGVTTRLNRLSSMDFSRVSDVLSSGRSVSFDVSPGDFCVNLWTRSLIECEKSLPYFPLEGALRTSSEK